MYNSRNYLFLILFALCLSFQVQGQMKYNQHNPYVSNADVFKLKELGIDLFEKPISDVEFKNNVKTLLNDRSKFLKVKTKRVVLVSLGVTGLGILTAGIVRGDKRSYTTRENKYLQVGSVLTALGVIGYSIGVPEFKSSKSKYEQQLQISRGQYDVLMSN